MLADKLPDVPTTLTEAVPVAAELLAVSVSTLVPVVGLVAKAAVTPLGKPEAASVTFPVNPFLSFTVIVDLPEAPLVTVREFGNAATVKFGAGLTVSVTVAVAVA